jgi:hypothetical protein
MGAIILTHIGFYYYQAFPGHDTSEDWVLSLTSLSGALNGTTRTYFDGML